MCVSALCAQIPVVIFLTRGTLQALVGFLGGIFRCLCDRAGPEHTLDRAAAATLQPVVLVVGSGQFRGIRGGRAACH